MFNGWKILTINGVIALLYGLLALFVPKSTVLAVVTYFGLLILIAGAFMLYGAILGMKNGLPWKSDLFIAVITMILGAMIAFYSQKTLTVFVILTGIWAIVTGATQLYYAFKVKYNKGRKNSMLFNGLLMLVFGIILFFNPFESVAFLVVLSGIIAIVTGIILLVLAFGLKDLAGEAEDI